MPNFTQKCKPDIRRTDLLDKYRRKGFSGISFSFHHCYVHTASIGNTLILIAFHKPSSLHPSSKVLLSCLATTDLCSGVILQPLVVVLFVSVLKESLNLCRLLLGIRVIVRHRCHSVWSRQQRRKTASFIVGATISTSCHFEENFTTYNFFLDHKYCYRRIVHVFMELPYFSLVWCYFIINMYDNFNILLREDLCYPSPLSNNSASAFFTSGNSNERFSIQKNSV